MITTKAAALFVTLAFAATANPQKTAVTQFRAPSGPHSDDVRAIHNAADGSLWVGTNGGGVSRFDGTQWTHFAADDLGMTSVSSIFPGANGDLWFAGPGGVTRFNGARWEHFGDALGRRIRVVFSGFVDRSGDVWLGTNVGAVRFDGETWEWTTTENGLRHDVVHDLLRDRSGSLWFATRRGGLSRLDGDEQWDHFHANDNVRAVLEDSAGNLWFGTGGSGVHHFDGTIWTRHYAGETVLPLFEDSRGNVWFTISAGGVLRYRNGEWFSHTEHMPTGETQAGGEGSDGSLWFGASSGLSRLRKVK